MKAVETNFLHFLNGQKQFIIPIYQRTYSWKLEHCRRLWDDILKAGNDDVQAHFIGSVVYIQSGVYHSSTIPQLLVIDGQQRLTTISLFLVALGNEIERRNLNLDISKRKLFNYYLLNSDEGGELRYKLLLTKSDKATLIRLIDEIDTSESTAENLKTNYKFFAEILSSPDIDLHKIYKGLGKLLIVDISLDRTYDNPQLIFESLNSTGLDLSQADLIRNYVLMGLEPKHQENLYNNYWYLWNRGLLILIGLICLINLCEII